MKKIITLAFFAITAFSSHAQFVARMEIKEDIPGLCDKKNVYALLSMFKGQKQAVCPVTNDTIEARLNREVVFLKDYPSTNDSGMVNILINCKGEVAACMMDNKTHSPELDKQIVAVFNTLGAWTPGTLDKKKVDSSRLWAFKIENGTITID